MVANAVAIMSARWWWGIYKIKSCPDQKLYNSRNESVNTLLIQLHPADLQTGGVHKA